ncbi:ribosomal L27 protein-domain-containing protein [Tuber borchii]|uniref:Large ribosomal subunit protein bL27m n=1 Tax=Tuber borchii TaxID=42251 RepID=A0A2T6ZT57_TUBBO|nr:ribosomal L27 protein-domain-containing protein [Tuber borchii]
MLLPRISTTGILPSLRNIGASGCGSNSGILQQVRHATHKASKAANGSSNTAGKRLGAKKTAGEKVVPGMIIYRQRGTLWFPGENAGIGRDHTIFALRTGYVRYYRDSGPKKRKSIGVALTPDQPLPRPPNAARTRRLWFEPVPLVEKEDVSVPQGTPLTQEDWAKVVPGSYIPRPDNWRIGKVMGPVVRKRSVFEGFERSAKRREARMKKLALKGGKTKKAKAKAKARAKKARGA